MEIISHISHFFEFVVFFVGHVYVCLLQYSWGWLWCLHDWPSETRNLYGPTHFLYYFFFKSFFHCFRLSESECKLNLFIVLFWCYFLSHLVLIKYILSRLGRTMKEYMISVCAFLPFSLSLPKLKWIVFIAINNYDLFMIFSSFSVPQFRKRTIFKSKHATLDIPLEFRLPEIC